MIDPQEWLVSASWPRKFTLKYPHRDIYLAHQSIDLFIFSKSTVGIANLHESIRFLYAALLFGFRFLVLFLLGERLLNHIIC